MQIIPWNCGEIRKIILHEIAQLVGSNATIYDLGCSTGALVPVLQNRYSTFNYIGIDKSPVEQAPHAAVSMSSLGLGIK